jgi:hypothetical protein
MKKAPFKLKSGNKPSMAKMAGVDPDAPGTPGKPGYEPPVRREELDKKGKKIFDANQAKKKKAKKINFKANNDYSQKAIDYRRTSDLEKYDDDRG